ncbi:MAG: hypothetical protein GPJ54_17840 [Candidatus Heimdallarchaeota archaeon]|nr:hypothetical protein [Candidatus Heimdallarchaeota archaeon]
MKIQLITGFILASLFLSTTIAVAGNQTQFTYVEPNLSPPFSPDLDLDQTSPSSLQLIQDTLDLLIDHKNETNNSWELSTLSTDNEVYYGIAGGMAGIGLKLLEALDYDIVKDNLEIKSDIIAIATEIGQELIGAGEINGSHALWNITDSDNYVDLSWDFGLAGIAAYYSVLFNHTLNNDFKITAQKTFTTIIDMTNTTNGLHWESDIYDFVNLDWYNPYDFDIFSAYDETPKTYSGLAFGTAGMAKSALIYLSMTDDGSNTTINQILTDSLTYLDNIAIINGSGRSFLVSEELFGLKSTNVANGASGIAQLYADLFDYTSINTYRDNALEIINWINGTTGELVDLSLKFRLRFGYEINETLIDEFELGITHGFAGVIDTLFEIGTSLSNDTALTLAEELADYLYEFSTDIGDDLEFYESTIKTISTKGSTSWAFGMSGIYSVLFKVANDDTSREDVAKMKNYLFSQIITNNSLSAIKTSSTGLIETNPSIGIPGFILMLSLQTIGKLNVETETLNFERTEIGFSKTMSIVVENLGEQSLTVSWNESQSTDVFAAANSGITIEGRGKYLLNLTFAPDEEKTYLLSDNIWVLEAGSSVFQVSLQGVGFDIPEISLTSSIMNNSLLESHGNVEFSLTVTDSSAISSVSIRLDTTIDILTFDQASNAYITTVSTNPLSNGTYNLVFSATDESDNTGQVTFVFEIGVYTSNIIDKAVSDNSRNILIGAIVVILAVAVIVTRFYMRSSD